mmetsp:Transcript_55087/g.156181  ORF Transcript_55087/g.156181 Transcript_55087/m.156181 type:complete len:937 (+) Transcript_55087:40-2850(+)
MFCCLQGIQGICQIFRSPKDHEEERANFEQIVAFLTSVPLFRKQLPRSELPQVAQLLTRKVWKPGSRLVKQGEPGRAFFLIESGKALVVNRDGDGEEEEQTRATLCAGDYFGGHTLTTERPNVASIMAAGPMSLVTLSMSREDFERSALKRWLKFPKRAAIYADANFEKGGEGFLRQKTMKVPVVPMSADEEEFVRNVVKKNANLRALLPAGSDKFSAIAAVAARRQVPAGTVVATCGLMGNEFFVICKGSFVVDLRPESCGASGGEQQSAECAVARSTMAERLLRKEHFLAGLTRQKLKIDGRRNSIAVGGMQKMQLITEAVKIDGRRNSIAFSGRPTGSLKICKSFNKHRAPRNDIAPSKMPEWEGSARNDPVAPDGEDITLGEGESFGELSLLYNTRREATFTAKEDSVVYVVSRKDFRNCFSRRGQRFGDIVALLDEVRSLEGLLSSERYELACNAIGYVDFRPGERVLTQGKKREARQWYVIATGSCIMTKEIVSQDDVMTTRRLAELNRPEHFGERSLLRGDSATEVHCDAGPQGMSCLTFDGDMIRDFLEGVFTDSSDIACTVHTTIEEWCSWKAKGWDRQVSTASNYRGSKEGQSVDLQDLRKVCMLGRGGYGQVTLVQESTQQNRYALKTMSRGYIHSQGAERLVRWERELLTMVRSPFVIRLHGTFTDEQHIFFLLEAALGGCLVDVLRSHPAVFREDTPRGSAAAFYAACLIAALEHLHERRIVHRDLKPENALLDERGYAKLCDMGFARFVLGKTNTLAGTPEYMAPEMIDFPHEHDMSVDWWALGVLTYEMLAGQTPFEDEGVVEPMGRLLALRRSQEKAQLLFPFHFPHASKGFVNSLLRKLPNRLGAKKGAVEVRSHQMFTTLKFDFECFHEHLMPSPFSQEWQDFLSTDDMGMDHGNFLGLDTTDPLFIPAPALGGDYGF